MADAPTRTLHEVGEGVFAWLQPGGESGVSNAGVIIDDDGITVVDTMMVRSQWEPFAGAVAKLGLPVRRVLLTHAHIDHVGGTRAFPMPAVVASPQTSALLEGDMPVAAYKAFMPAFDAEFDELAEIGTRQVTHLVTDAAQLTPRIEVLPATGHTEGDLMALVADVDVLFAGDLCFFGVTPLAFQGNPETWADVLDAIADLADVIVPGHGPIGAEPQVRELQSYLRHCVAVARGEEPSIPPGPWDAWPEREPRDQINVERAVLCDQQSDDMPPAMLKALGLR
ncbi:MAG: Zn-dependent hydrolase, glyoxylase [Actinomycetia bacterium]|nr:Zn-dependent hydrolase, glyoxylase [Actinomycetes bacterium]